MKLTPMKLAMYKSIALHVVVAILLLISVSFNADPLLPMPSDAPVIQATFIDAQAIADKKRAQEQAEAQARAAEQERKRKADEKRRQEAAAAKRADEKRKAAEAEKQRKKLEQIAAQKEKERKEREAQEKADAERKKQEAQEKAEMERIMQEQLKAEQAAQRERRRQQVMTEVERYTALIQQTIIRNLYDDDSYDGKECRLNMKLATTGFVTDVRVLKGFPALCQAAETAIRKAEKMPMSDAPDVYEQLKNINITVRL